MTYEVFYALAGLCFAACNHSPAPVTDSSTIPVEDTFTKTPVSVEEGAYYRQT